MPRPKITFKSTVLDLELENVEFTVGPETIKVGRLKASLDVADLLRVQLPALVGSGAEGVMFSHDGNRKIQCIKQVRAMTGWGLKDSKAFVERAPVLLKATDLLTDYPDEDPINKVKEAVRVLAGEGATVEIVYKKERIPTVLDRFREMLVEALGKKAKGV